MIESLEIFDKYKDLESPINIIKKHFPEVETQKENEIALKKLLTEEYFYTAEEVSDFLQKTKDFDSTCLQALLSSTNVRFEDIKIKGWSVKKLNKQGYKIPECYLIISNLKKDYKATNKLLKGGGK